jgi:hypothetical protein
MKFGLSIIFVIWLILTTILALSIIGWVIILPVFNDTQYFKGLEDRRSTWMTLGLDLKNNLLKL